MWLFDKIKEMIDNQNFNPNNLKDRKVTFINTNNESNLNELKKNNPSFDIKEEIKINYEDNKYTMDEKKALFLYCMDYPNKVLEEENYSRKYKYDLNIDKVKQFHENLIKEEYFKKADFNEVINKYKVAEIKEILVKNNIIFGKEKKDQLIQLLNDKLDNTNKNNIVDKSGLYVLTEKAYAYISNYDDLIYFYNHKNWGIPYWFYKNEKAKREKYLKRGDIIWGIFNDRLMNSNNSFGNLCGIYRDMADFLEEEKNMLEALKYGLICLYFELNMYFIQDTLKIYKPNGLTTKKEIIEYTENTQAIYEKDVEKLKKLSVYYDNQIFDKVVSFCRVLPYEIFSKDEFVDIVDKIYKDEIEIEKYNYLAIERMKKIIEEKCK